MPRKTPASPAVHFLVPPELAEDFRDACAGKRRSQEDVFRQYLAAVQSEAGASIGTTFSSKGDGRKAAAGWPESEYPGVRSVGLVLRPSKELADGVRTLAERTCIRASDWYRLAVWRAVQAGAAPPETLAQAAEVAS